MTPSSPRTSAKPARATKQAAARKKLNGARGAPAAKKVAKKVAKKSTKQVAKRVAKSATRKTANAPAKRTGSATTTRAPKATRAATPAPAPIAKPAAPAPDTVKAPKPDRVRDKFSLPAADYALIDKLKLSARRNGLKAKKNDLLRLGLQALDALSSSELQDRLLTLRAHDKRSAKKQAAD
jgi:hypothetical protein